MSFKLKFFPFVSRAPPKKTFEDYVPDDDGSRYVLSEDSITDDLSQLRPEIDADFNQEANW